MFSLLDQHFLRLDQKYSLNVLQIYFYFFSYWLYENSKANSKRENQTEEVNKKLCFFHSGLFWSTKVVICSLMPKYKCN